MRTGSEDLHRRDDILDLIGGSKRPAIVAVWCVGAAFWAGSLFIHRWDDRAQAIGCDLALAALAGLALRIALGAARNRAYGNLFVCWFAIFGADFFLFSFGNPPEVLPSVSYVLLILVLILLRWRYNAPRN